MITTKTQCLESTIITAVFLGYIGDCVGVAEADLWDTYDTAHIRTLGTEMV